MASALAHSLYRNSSLDQGIHRGSGLPGRQLSHYQASAQDHRTPLPIPPPPMFLKDISRSSSSSTQSSGNVMFQQPQFFTRSASLSADRTEEYNRQQPDRTSLPGLNTLASLATTREPETRSFPVIQPPNMGYNQLAPIPTPGISGNHNLPPVCQNCETSTTPLWRRDESGSVLCNACGLFLKLHGRPRPISLKTDVIKSRNRVKTANQGPKRQLNQQSLPASQSIDIHNGAHRRMPQMTAPNALNRSHSPISRTGTPMHHDPNIAPQHMFDGVSLQDHVFQAPALPSLGNHPSPGSMMSLNDRPQDGSMSYEQLLAQNTILKTRVSELEVIQMVYSDTENNLRRERDDAVKAQDDLKRKVEELEKQLQASNSVLEHPNKRARVESPATAEQQEQQPVTNGETIHNEQ